MANRITRAANGFPVLYAIYTANKAEQKAFKRLYDRWTHPDVNERARLSCSYREFRRQVLYDSLNGCFMWNHGGIWIGIEPDGYTHS